MDQARMETPELRERGSRPARITEDGRLFIGDDEIRQPVTHISASRQPNQLNLLTVTFIVGEITVEAERVANS